MREHFTWAQLRVVAPRGTRRHGVPRRRVTGRRRAVAVAAARPRAPRFRDTVRANRQEPAVYALEILESVRRVHVITELQLWRSRVSSSPPVFACHTIKWRYSIRSSDRQPLGDTHHTSPPARLLSPVSPVSERTCATAGGPGSPGSRGAVAAADAAGRAALGGGDRLRLQRRSRARHCSGRRCGCCGRTGCLRRDHRE
jgi:hypothetical protein